MAPALLRFYGGSKDWEAMPWGDALRYHSAIPRIKAQEAGMPAAGIAGFDFAKMIEDFKLDMPKVPEMPRAKPAVKSPEELKRIMSSMGIGVEVKS